MTRLSRLSMVGFCVAVLAGSGRVIAEPTPEDSKPAKKEQTGTSSKHNGAVRDQDIESDSTKKDRPSTPAKQDGGSVPERNQAKSEDVKPYELRSPATKSSRGDSGPSAIIREPSQGRPIFITPGETFYFVMRLTPEVKGDVGFSLIHSTEPSIRMSLKPTTPPSYVNDEYCSLILQVPSETAPGLYNIQVKTDGASYTSPHSIRVVDTFKTKFRFVHLSNMNIGDLTAPNFDEMLPKEINLLAPEFIIATGDYTEWARARDDASSWPKVLKFFEQFNAPAFLLCGAHDHEVSFTRFVASKPIGTVDYGNYHGLLLLDHPGNPIEQGLQPGAMGGGGPAATGKSGSTSSPPIATSLACWISGGRRKHQGLYP